MTIPRQLQLLSIAPSCSMRELLEEAAHLAAFDPEILTLIENNLDTAAIVKKRERVADAEWEDSMVLLELMQEGLSDNMDREKTALAHSRMGGREPNFGFKAQMANSGNGFITAMIVERGNTSDSESFIPLLDEAIARTGVVPTVATVDDGYSSQLNWRRAHNIRKVEVVSISGSKWRAVIGEELYESEAYKDARRIRGKGARNPNPPAYRRSCAESASLVD